MKVFLKLILFAGCFSIVTLLLSGCQGKESYSSSNIIGVLTSGNIPIKGAIVKLIKIKKKLKISTISNKNSSLTFDKRSITVATAVTDKNGFFSFPYKKYSSKAIYIVGTRLKDNELISMISYPHLPVILNELSTVESIYAFIKTEHIIYPSHKISKTATVGDILTNFVNIQKTKNASLRNEFLEIANILTVCENISDNPTYASVSNYFKNSLKNNLGISSSSVKDSTLQECAILPVFLLNFTNSSNIYFNNIKNQIRFYLKQDNERLGNLAPYPVTSLKKINSRNNTPSPQNNRSLRHTNTPNDPYPADGGWQGTGYYYWPSHGGHTAYYSSPCDLNKANITYAKKTLSILSVEGFNCNQTISRYILPPSTPFSRSNVR